ncbi:hypothetical protein EDB83DRAFT_1059184 [Lactarius deliciosus]|nr:hypothetical protein EDB83DRAFT_1059184 [Lactarius deliciosus]
MKSCKVSSRDFSGFHSAQVRRNVTARLTARNTVWTSRVCSHIHDHDHEALHPPRLWLRLIASQSSRSRRKRRCTNSCSPSVQTLRLQATLATEASKAEEGPSYLALWTQSPLGSALLVFPSSVHGGVSAHEPTWVRFSSPSFGCFLCARMFLSLSSHSLQLDLVL